MPFQQLSAGAALVPFQLFEENHLPERHAIQAG
jgi:hypothetical protein